jgi:hypothetical protein
MQAYKKHISIQKPRSTVEQNRAELATLTGNPFNLPPVLAAGPIWQQLYAKSTSVNNHIPSRVPVLRCQTRVYLQHLAKSYHSQSLQVMHRQWHRILMHWSQKENTCLLPCCPCSQALPFLASGQRACHNVVSGADCTLDSMLTGHLIYMDGALSSRPQIVTTPKL